MGADPAAPVALCIPCTVQAEPCEVQLGPNNRFGCRVNDESEVGASETNPEIVVFRSCVRARGSDVESNSLKNIGLPIFFSRLW